MISIIEKEISDIYLMGSYSPRSEEHTSELQSQSNLVCRLLLEKKKKKIISSSRDLGKRLEPSIAPQAIYHSSRAARLVATLEETRTIVIGHLLNDFAHGTVTAW